jgi:two-component system sensor histidine kinase/response regulator
MAAKFSWLSGLESRAEKTVRLHISVQDTGIGIAPEKQEAMFDAFSQADGSTTRRYGGTGLGLSICKRLIQMMNGRTWLESELGRGTTVHFTAEFALQDAAVEIPEWEETGLSGLEVLVVDDNDTSRRILVEAVQSWQMKPTGAASGEEALRALERRTFDLMLLDMRMPGMDGVAVADAIRQRWPRLGSRVLSLCSLGQRADADRDRALNAEAYLCKPVKRSDLLASIQALMRGAEDARTEAGTRPSPRGNAADRVPERVLKVLVAEDNLVNQTVARRLLEKRGHRVVVADNGLRAVEAFEREEFDLILMDVQMPEMDGFEAAAAIREREAHPSTRGPGCRCGRVAILGLTAYAMAGDRERCLSSGMDGYLSKPVRVDELLESIAAVVRDGTEVASLRT